jgi:hypothetical protein
MADRFLNVGIKYNQSVSKAELDKLKNEIKSALGSFNLSVNLKGVVSEAKKVADETKAVLKDLESFREWQDTKRSTEAAARLSKNLQEEATARKQKETEVSRELLNIQRGYHAQVQTLNKQFTAEGMVPTKGKTGVTWSSAAMTATDRAEIQKGYRIIEQEAKRSESERVTLAKSAAQEINRAHSEANKLNKTFDATQLRKWREETERVVRTHKTAVSSTEDWSHTVRKLHANFLPIVAELYVAKQAWDMTAGAIMNYLGTLETAQNGIAAGLMTGGQYVDQTTGKVLEAQEAFKAAQSQTVGIMKELQVANFETLATLDELVVAYQTAIPIGLAKAFDPKMIKDFTVSMVQAAGAIGLPFNQMAEEIRSLLQGTINPRNSRIAVALGITNEDVRRYKGDAEGLFNFLMGKLEAYRLAGAVAQDSWAGLWNNTKDIALMVGGQVLAPLFDFIKQELRDIQKALLDVDETTGKIKGFKPEVVESVKGVTSAIEQAIVTVYGLREAFDLTAGTATDLYIMSAKIGKVASGQWLLPEAMTKRISSVTGMPDYNEMERYWGAVQTSVNQSALDNAQKIQAIDMKAQNLMGATSADLQAFEHGGTDPRLVRATVKAGLLERGAYYKKIPDEKDTKYTPKKKDDDTKVSKQKNTYSSELASDKAILQANLQILKSGLDLQQHELDMFHDKGMLSTSDYYASRMVIITEGLEAEIKAENEGYAILLADIKKKQATNLANDEGKNTKAINDAAAKELLAAKKDHEKRQTEMANKGAKERIDIAYGEYRDLLKIQQDIDKYAGAMGGISAQGVLDKLGAQIEQEKDLYDYLYEAKKVKATEWFKFQEEIDRRETDLRKRSIQNEYDKWVTENKTTHNTILEQGNPDAVEAMQRERATKVSERNRALEKEDADLQTRMQQNSFKIADSVSAAFDRDGVTGAIGKSFDLISRDYADTGKNILDATKTITSGMEDSFSNFLDYTSDKFLDFKSLALDVLNEIYKAMLKAMIIQPLVNGITSGLGGLFSSSTATTSSSNFSGAYSNVGSNFSFLAGRALGGPTYAGESYLVGESGKPEILTMGRNNGYVTPIGGGQQTIKISVNVNNSGQPARIVSQEVNQIRPSEYVVNLWMEGFQQNVGGLRDMLGR